jgi:hypothetical protein
MPRMKSAIASNRLLTALPNVDRRRILAQCDQVELAASDVLHEAGTLQQHVISGPAVSSHGDVSLAACAGLEVILVGREGMVGVSILLGIAVSPLHHPCRAPAARCA